MRPSVSMIASCNAAARRDARRAPRTVLPASTPRALILAAACALSGLAAPAANAATLVVEPPRTFAADAYIAGGQDSAKNYGASDELVVGDKDQFHRALIWFDLGAIPPGSRINSAKLDLYLENTSGPSSVAAEISVHAVRRAWAEGDSNDSAASNGATWRRASAAQSWTSAGADFDSIAASTISVPDVKNIRYLWDVTSLVERWVAGADSNYGFILKIAKEASDSSSVERIFASNDANQSGRHPRITIDYTPVSSQISILQPASAAAGIDAFIRSGGDALKNYGRSPTLTVADEATLSRGLVRFDLSSIPAADRIDWATLDLYTQSVAGAETTAIAVHRVTRSWTEGTGLGSLTLNGASWMSTNGLVTWISPGGDFAASPSASEFVPAAIDHWQSWEITDLVNAWHDSASANFGAILKIGSESTGAGRVRAFQSSDAGNATLNPRLTLYVTPNGNIPSAVDSARAEITPNATSAGSSTSYTYSILTFASAKSTGVDRVAITLPTGFTLNGVSAVTVNLLPRAFTNISDSAEVRIAFSTPVTGSARIEVFFSATAPAAYDSPSYALKSSVDDASTASPEVACVEGSANLILLDANSWDVVVNPPGLLSLRVTPDSATVSADSALDFTATLTDVIGGTSTVEPSWGVTGSIGTINATGLFTATTPGSGRVTASYLGLADSAGVRVTAGAPASVTISPASASVSADSTRQFTAVVRDADGNVVSTAVTWSVLGGVGTIDAGGLFTASVAGAGSVRATAGGAIGSAPVTVTPGAAVSIALSPDSVGVSADSTATFSATARDADGNVTAGTVAWSVAGGVGSIAGGVFTATTAGSGWVIATILPSVASDEQSPGAMAPGGAGGPQPLAAGASDSARVTVVPGALAAVTISPAAATLSSDSTLLFAAAGADLDGNVIAAFVPSWNVLGAIGTITSGGLFDARRLGSGRVVASNGGAAPADSADVTVVAGQLAGVSLAPSAATLSPGDTTAFALRGQDADANVVSVPPAGVLWATTDPTGSITAAGLYTAGANLSPPSYEVSASYGGFGAAAAINIISAGTLSRVEIADSTGAAVGALARTADEDGLRLQSLGYGSANELLGPIPCTWSVIGDSGVIVVDGGPDIEEIADFVRTGAARVRIDGPAGLADSTGTISVSAGALATIAVSPGPLAITTDTTLAFTAAAADADGNAVGAGTIGWSVGGGIGTIGASSGVFDPTTPGAGFARATSSAAGVSGDSPAISVSAGAVASLVVSPGTAFVPLGTTRQFSASALDADGNAIGGSPSWSVAGAAGTVNASGLFSASSAGAASVIASLGGKADTAEVTVAEPGSLRLLSVDAPRATVTEGQSGIVLSLRFRNESSSALTSFTPSLAPRDETGAPLAGSVIVESVDAPASVAAGADSTIALTVALAPSLSAGTRVVLDASLLATGAGGAPQFDADADATDEWLVEAPPKLVDAENTVWPRRLRRGAGGVSLALRGWNEGGVAVDLDPAATRLVFSDGGAAYSAPLASPISLPRDSSIAEIGFDTSPVPAAMTAGIYPLTLIVGGVDSNGKAYAETLVTEERNEVTVLPPYVTVTAAPVAGGAVRPGDTNVPALAFEIENGYPDAKTLTALTLGNTTAGPGSVAQRDAEFARVGLVWDRDADGAVGAADSLLAEGAFASGATTMTGLALAIGSEEAVRIVVAVDVAAGARDGDSLDLAIGSAAGVAFAGSPTIDGAFPINPAGRLAVDGSTAAQFGVALVAPRTVTAGEALVTALDVTIPPNGYAADTLTALAIALAGSAEAGTDIERVTLVRRSGAGAAAAAAAGAGGAGAASDADSTIGEMAWTGARWVRTGMSVPIPPGGLRVAALVSVADSASEGATIALSIPAGENAVTVRSGNDGPVDAGVDGGGPLTIALYDRIIAVPFAVATAGLPQGAADVPLASFILGNTYATPETLASIRFAADASFLDASRADSLFAGVALCFDADQNGAVDADEPPVATANASGGVIAFGGLDIAIAPGQSAYFAIMGGVSLRARDGDAVRLRVASASDVAFTRALTIDGEFPLASTPMLPVWGMTAASIANHGAPPRAAAPGERGVLVLDVSVPPNGYEPDTLRSFRVENAGSATAPGDVAALRLYSDDGDGAFDAKTDALVDALSFVGSGWLADALALDLPAGGRRLFVAADVAALPTDSATIALRIPTGGLSVESANDGPFDAAVSNAFAQTISTSPLLVSVAFSSPSASSGQEVELRLTAFNAGDEAIDGIVPNISAMAGTGSATLLGAASPDSLSLDPAETKSFTWRVRAGAPGSATYTVFARGHERTSGAEVSSTPIAAGLLAIVNPPASVTLFATDLAPPTVARGTADVVPLSLTFAAAGAPPFAPVEIRALNVVFDDGAGRAVAAADLAGRLAVREASTLFHATSSIPASPAVRLELDTPIVVSPGDPATVALALDVRGDTRVASYRMSVGAPIPGDVVDANSGAAIPVVLDAGAFPIRSGTTNVAARPSELRLSIESRAPATANRGQADVPMLRLRFESIGDTAVTADVRIHEVAFQIIDSAAAAVDSIFTRVSLSDGAIVFGSRSGVFPGAIDTGGSDSTGAPGPPESGAIATIRLPLSTPIVLPINSVVFADLDVTIAADAGAAGVRFRIDSADSSLLPSARDVATDKPLAVSLSAPFVGPLVRITSRATALLAASVPLPPASVYPGTSGVPLLRLALRHPGAADQADVLVPSITLAVTDDIGNPEGAGTRLLSFSAMRNGVAIGGVQVAESADPIATISLAAPVSLAPGESTEVEVRATVRGIAERGRIRVRAGANALRASDASDGTPIVPTASSGAFPFVSAPLSILALPLDPVVAFRDRAPVTAPQGASAVPIAGIVITNPASADAGAVSLASIRFVCRDRAERALDPGALFATIRARAGAGPAVASAAAEPCRIDFSPRLSIAPGESLAIAFDGDLVASPAVDAFLLTLADSGVVFASPAPGANAPRARATAGASFPFATGLVGIAAPRFAESVSNYPNPFAAGREETQFLFFMPEPGEVEIAIYTPLGEPVARIASRGVAGPGMIPAIAWDGRNADGETVLSGVYLADVRVRFLSGRSDSAIRKVAVLR